MKKARWICLIGWSVATSGLLAGNGYGVDLYTSDTETPEPRSNELTISTSKPDFDDSLNPSAITDSIGIKDEYAFGVERLYWENDPDSDWRLFLDSQFLFRPDDYKVRFQAVKPDERILTIDFRYWEEYDYGAGIYYPARDSFYVLDPDLLRETIKRFKISYQAMPSYENRWKITYSLFERTGDSLSTRFGDDYQYRVRGIKSRGMVPSMISGDERVQKLDFEFKRQEEVDRKGFRVHYQMRESDRQRTSERGAVDASAHRYSRSEEKNEDDLFGVSGYTRKQLTDSMYGSIGVAYTRMDGDITGARVFGADPEAQYDIDFISMQLDDHGFLDLDATRKLRQVVANANVVYDPEGNYRWMAGVRFEHMSSEVFSSYIDTWRTFDFADLARQSQEAAMTAASEKTADDISGFLELRYKGFSKAQLYTRVEAGKQDGDMGESWTRTEIVPNPDTRMSLLERANGFDRNRTFWEAGVNYYPITSVQVSVEGYIKQKENSYDYSKLVMNPADWTAYPGFLEEQETYTEDLNARVNWKVFSWLKSVSRIDLQNSTIENKGRSLAEIEAAERERMVFNQSIVLTPHPRLFVNATYQLVDDLTETPATGLQYPFDGIIVNIPNDYWQMNVNVFYVLTKMIDLQLGYYYLEMDNYLDTSPNTVPYGNDIEQHQGSVDLIFHLGDATVARLGYNYYEQTYTPAQENRDYTVHLMKASLQRKF